MSKKFKVALIQTSSSDDTEKNLAKMKKQATRAASQGARWVIFPEMAYLMSGKPIWRHEVPRYQERIETFQSWAKELGVTLIPGSLREPSSDKRFYYNSLPVISSAGKLLGTYRKIHLFQATLPDRRYRESAYTAAGNEAMVTEIDGIPVGLSVCFDLRFPELYRTLKHQGAKIVLVPSAFVHLTGLAHWEILLRARAIENQFFILAPNQCGVVGTGTKTFGHTCAIAPWGEVLKVKKNLEGIVSVDIDLDELTQATSRVDAWASRRADVFSSFAKM